MKAAALMYHDVVEGGAWSQSGFRGADADRYKLDRRRFREHLTALQRAGRQPTTVLTPAVWDGGAAPLFLTFDDGGVSAHTTIADLLEEFGWRGHFFVTAGRIGTPGFLAPEQIRDLYRRGHVIGAHSWSHPMRMSSCGWEQLLDEWSRSTAALAELLGEPVLSASVPGGHHSRRVAEAAARAGIRTLFTSEPTVRGHRVEGTRVLGRYTIQQGTPPGVAVALAAGGGSARPRQFVLWNAKKITKKLGGEYYLKVRKAILTDGG